MTAEDLLDILEQRQLVSPGVLISLRRQVQQAAKPVAPAALVKLLVDKQQITPGQAQQLLKANGAPQRKAPAPASSPSLEVELGLSPSTIGSKQSTAPSGPPASGPAATGNAQPALKPSAATQSAVKQPARATPAVKQPARAKPPGGSSLSLEEELGLAASNSQTLRKAQPAAAAAGPAAPAKPGPSAVARASAAEVAGAGVTGPARPTKKAAADAASADLGLADDLLADLGPAGGSLFDEGLLSAAAAGDVASPAGFPTADPLAAAGVAETAAVALAPRPVRKSRLTRILKVGGASLAVLLVAGGSFLAWYLRGSGEPEFKAAEQDYQAQAWPAALAKYNELLRDYPSQPHAAAARVHRGMCELRQSLTGRPDWQRVLETLERVLPEVAVEPQFSELHAELATILGDTAEALTQSVVAASDPAEAERRIQQSRRALALAADPHYLPPAERPWQRCQRLDDQLAVRSYELARPAALAGALKAIRESVAAGRISAGDAARQELVAQYPELADNDALRTALDELAVARAALVKPLDVPARAAESAERPNHVTAQACLVVRPPTAAGLNSGRPAFVWLAEALYALDSGTGRPLWRRALGAGAQYPPLALPGEAPSAGDVLVCDTRYNELLRIDAATGRLRWRQSYDAPACGPPLVIDAGAFVLTQSGLLHRIELKSGRRTSTVELPPPAAPLVASHDRRYLFELTGQGELVALAADKLTVARAFYVGAGLGLAAYTPLALEHCLLVGENHGVRDGALRPIGLDADGLPERALDPQSLHGRLAAQPLVLGNQVLAVNQAGGIRTFQLTGQRDAPLKPAGSAEPRTTSGGAWFVLGSDKQFWVAGLGLRPVDLQPQGRIAERTALFERDLFDQCPSLAGTTLVAARRTGDACPIVAGLSARGETLWATQFNCLLPASCAPLAKARELEGMSTQGAASRLSFGTSGELKTIEQPRAKAAAGSDSFCVAGGLRTAAGGSIVWRQSRADEVFVGGSDGSVPRRMALPARAAADPVLFAGGLLVPGDDGALHLLDLRSGKSLAAAYRPRIQAGTRCGWSAAALSATGQDLLIGDEGSWLYQVGFRQEPQPQLSKTAAVELPASRIAGPVVAGKGVYVVTDDGLLRAFELTSLKPAGEWKLPARQASAMQAAGALLLVASGDKLLGCGAGSKSLWEMPLPTGGWCGQPLADRRGVLILSRTGRVARIAADTGKELASVDLAEPLIAGPWLIDGAPVVLAADGCLLKVALP